MQQIDEIRKMSELARTLRANGLAKDNLDAIHQAQSVTSSDPQVLAQRKQEQIQQNIELLQRKVDNQQKKIDALQSSLEQTQKKLSDALVQLNGMSAKIRNLEATNVQPQSWAISQMQGSDKVPSTIPIDRNGVAPADVSIEKMFYFGKR